jgi:hypothetical protein
VDVPGDSRSFHGLTATYFADYFFRQTARAALPLSESTLAQLESPTPEPAVERISTHAVIFPLGDDDSMWGKFHDAFTYKKQGNLRPWYRCMGILRGMGALCAIVEMYYVCLDYRSEFASFYAHIDAPRKSHTVRLHFFTDTLTEADLVLLKEHSAAYLGYIVCREGDLPLVGRALLRVPDYIEESTEIEEYVNLFGQRLPVRGVPFMQQDQRFAVCAHVAMWVIHYSAYRRGLTERRLIANLVNVAGNVQSLHPRAAEGLTERQVTEALTHIGFRPTMYISPSVDDTESNLPRVRYREIKDRIPAEFIEKVEQALLESGDEFGETDLADKNVKPVLEKLLQNFVDRSDDAVPGSDDDIPMDPRALEVLAMQALLDYIVRPYIISGFPVYARVQDHALVICGRAQRGNAGIYFAHDDQNGPYLLADPFPTLSRDSLKFQSGHPISVGSSRWLDLPALDRTGLHLNDGLEIQGTDAPRPVLSLILATPPRVLLPASLANRRALETMDQLQSNDVLIDSLGCPEPRTSFVNASNTRVSILMGIDYKIRRRDEAAGKLDDRAVEAYSALQLAEWVVVVEGTTLLDDQSVVWECVFDASSSEAADPRLQMSRVLSTMVTVFPGTGSSEASEIGTNYFRHVSIPLRVAKVVRSDK